MSEFGQRIGNTSEVTELIGPDDVFRHKDRLVMLDDTVPLFEAINGALRKAGRPERCRVIGKEDLDQIEYEGILTAEEAVKVIDESGKGSARISSISIKSQPATRYTYEIDPELIQILERTKILKRQKGWNDNNQIYRVNFPFLWGIKPFSAHAEVTTQVRNPRLHLHLTFEPNFFTSLFYPFLNSPRGRGMEN